MTGSAARQEDEMASQAARIFTALAARKAFGLCLFDETGIVTAQNGAGAGFLPAPGSSVEDNPLLIGLMDSLLGLQTSGGFFELPSLGLGGPQGDRFDVQICWLDSEKLFAAMVYPASGRTNFEFEVAQAARENRLLLEKIREQQDQIKAQNELMRIFITHVPAAVAMLDKDMNYLMVSQRWCDDFAVQEKDILQKPFAGGLPADARRWQAALKRSGAATSTGIEKLVTAGGTQGWHRWERQNWPAVGKNDGGTLVFSENITRTVEQTRRLRAQAARLAALNAEMKQFSLAISHDLRAPIRQIGAFSQFLSEEYEAGLGDEGAEFVARISDCAARMMAMVDALLAYAKVSQAQTTFVPVELGAIVASARANLAADMAAHDASIDCPPGIALQGDPALLALVFQNLIDNSLKYAAADPVSIVIDAHCEGDKWVIGFADNGPGIAVHLQSKAFDLFQRLGAAQSVSGAGVGLAMCRKIIELHGGTMAIDPEFAGGLRYELRLPRNPDREPSGSPGSHFRT